MNGGLYSGLRVRQRKTLADEEDHERGDQKKHEWIPGEAVGEFLPSRGLQAFLDRQGPDVTYAATVQIACAGVVDGMLPPPVVVGCECEKSRYESPNVVGPARLEERTVPAVVKDDEDAQDHRSGQNREGNSQPPGDRKAEIHEDPEGDIASDRVEYLPAGSPAIRVLMFGNEFPPIGDGSSVAGLFKVLVVFDHGT